jgi:nickel/cobalt exporter
MVRRLKDMQEGPEEVEKERSSMRNTEREKIKILLNHWIKHNKEHSQEFREWAEKAEGLGDAETSVDILEAAQQMDKANDALVRALKRLEH